MPTLPSDLPVFSLKRAAFSLLSLLTLLGCDLGGDVVSGSGTLAEETRSAPGATEVVMHGVGRLVLRQGSEATLVVSADDNILPLLHSDVENGVLTLEPQDGLQLAPETPIVYRLTLPNIERVTSSGVTRVEIGAVESPRFRLQTSGSSTASLERLVAAQVRAESSGSSTIDAQIEATEAKVQLSGSSRITLRGRANEQRVESSGSSFYEAGQLRAHRIQTGASGASEQSLFVDETLRVGASGASSVRYRGGAQLTRSLSGTATVRED